VLSQNVTESHSTRPFLRGARPARGATAELGAGVVLLGGATLAGLVFARRPWPDGLDAWGYRLLPANPAAGWAHALVGLGSLSALLGGVLVVFLVGILRDRVRSVTCAIAPVLAVLIVQDIAKPLVDRHTVLSGGTSYPSGTVAAVAALVTAFTLVMPARTRLPVAMVGFLATLGTCAAVVVLRWHYPTDALGGAAVGVGSVLVIDGILSGFRIITGLLDHRARREVNDPATMGGGSIGTLVSGVGRHGSYREPKGMDGHAQVHHHGNSREWEGDAGQVVGR
jgi:membrane-associated phospholipid phosphatase